MPRGSGRRVVASLNGRGGYAERAVAAAPRLIEVPHGMSLRDAVALLADGRTALSLARLAELRAGETVVVEAAAGGVGSLLVQLAHHAGARVVALAGGGRKLTLVRELGADVGIDYRGGDWAGLVRDAVGDVDVVFDGVGGQTGLAAFGLLRPAGGSARSAWRAAASPRSPRRTPRRAESPCCALAAVRPRTVWSSSPVTRSRKVPPVVCGP